MRNPYINEELQALGEQARRFAAGRVAPGFVERDRTRHHGPACSC